MTAKAKFLSLLKSHAVLHGDALVHMLADRAVTYRRLWARIERASARLQGEWGVQAGEVVAYAGNAHPDAMVLYFALLRIGAVLLPIEGHRIADAKELMRLAGATLVVHDDALQTELAPGRALSALLAQWCHFDPVPVAEDPAVAALLLPFRGKSGWGLIPLSLYELVAAVDTVPKINLISGSLFDFDTMSGVIFPALYAVQPLTFAGNAQEIALE